MSEPFTPPGNAIGTVEAKAIMARLKAGRQDTAVSNALEEIIPPPEVANHPVELTDERVPRGTRTLAKRALAAGFEVYRLTYARGPWMHSSQWTVLRIADSIVLGIRHPDGRAAVATWVTDGEGKYGMESAHLLRPHLAATNSNGLKTYIDTPADRKVDLASYDTPSTAA